MEQYQQSSAGSRHSKRCTFLSAVYSDAVSTVFPLHTAPLCLLCRSFGADLLKGPIPTHLGQLKSLVRLSLQENKLEGELPTELGELQSLEFMIFATNMLNGTIPAQLGKLDKLSTL